jgi:hypothetical protein
MPRPMTFQVTKMHFEIMHSTSGMHLSHHMMMRYIFDRMLKNNVKYDHQPTDITEQM